MPRGRFAPSPTGRLHLGNALSALVAWLSIRSQGGQFIWRVEDLDGPRTIPGMDRAALEDLSWLGLDWDEGPDVSGPYTPYYQSQRSEYYEAALCELAKIGRLFPCRLSRKDLLKLASAPHDRDSPSPYPHSLRPQHLEKNWYEAFSHSPSPYAAIRYKVDPRPIVFTDRVYGSFSERLYETVGDFVLKRRDGLYAYQLAVVVDDLLMGITEVVRGEDLLTSTARQIQLIESLGGRRPIYAHVPLVVNISGDKLSKRDSDLELSSLREKGVRPEQLAGYFGYTLGFIEKMRPCQVKDLIPLFSWDKMPRTKRRIPDDFQGRLLKMND